jgi:hypothetical protein
MPARPFVALACLAAAVAGCGGGDEPRAQTPPPPPVELDVTSPDDMATVRTATVEVRGTVTPAGAVVRVLGQPATVSGGGTFSARVPLDPGNNVIDVIATARRRGPALTAFRVTREMPVVVPDLGGLDVAAVQEKLGSAGLGVDVEHGGGLLEQLLPGEPAVCEQDPEPGAKARRGTTVHVVVAKSC